MSLLKENSGSYLKSRNRQDSYEISQPIPVAGQRKHGIDYAKRRLEVAQEDYREVERNVIYSILSSWIHIWLGKNTIQLLENGQDIANELIRINELRLKNQIITRSELQRTRILRDQYSVNRNKIKTELDAELRTLSSLLAIDGEDQLEIGEFGSEILPKPIYSIESSINYALSNRSDLKVAEGNERASLSKLRLEEANKYPRPEIGVIANPQNGEGYYGASVTIPIPIFDRNQGEIERAKAEIINSSNKRDAIEIQVRADTKNAFHIWTTAKMNRDSYRDTLKSAEDVLTTVQYSYTKGGTSLVDFLNAQEQWFETRENFLQLDAGVKKAYLDLLYATGFLNSFGNEENE